MDEPRPSKRDLRRAPRVAGDFWTMVQGVDDAPTLRRGNISRSGMIFSVEAPLDVNIGGLEYLHVMSRDRSRGVVVMAQVVRVVTFDGPDGREGNAIAFEFMPESPESRTKLERIVAQAVLEAEPEPEAPPAAAQVFKLEVPHLRLEATWPVEVGERVQLCLLSFGGDTRVPFEGIVKAVQTVDVPVGPPRYAVDVQMGAAGSRAEPRARSLTESIDLAMSELVTTEVTLDLVERQHLAGQLEHISLASLLGWFEMERMSGRLAVKDWQGQVDLLMRDGALVDVETASDVSDPKEILRTVLGWTEGTFEFQESQIEVEDRIRLPLSALLIDLAREADESSGRIAFVA